MSEDLEGICDKDRVPGHEVAPTGGIHDFGWVTGGKVGGREGKLVGGGRGREGKWV